MEKNVEKISHWIPKIRRKLMSHDDRKYGHGQRDLHSATMDWVWTFSLKSDWTSLFPFSLLTSFITLMAMRKITVEKIWGRKKAHHHQWRTRSKVAHKMLEHMLVPISICTHIRVEFNRRFFDLLSFGQQVRFASIISWKNFIMRVVVANLSKHRPTTSDLISCFEYWGKAPLKKKKRRKSR